MWSPSGLGSNFYNLMFTYDEAFRMSYASSFGVKKFRGTREDAQRIILRESRLSAVVKIAVKK